MESVKSGSPIVSTSPSYPRSLTRRGSLWLAQIQVQIRHLSPNAARPATLSRGGGEEAVRHVASERRLARALAAANHDDGAVGERAGLAGERKHLQQCVDGVMDGR